MTTPALVYGALMAVALAAAFHLVLGRSLRQLPRFLLASLVGFALGHVLAPAVPFALPTLGLLHPVQSGLASIALMSVVRAIWP